jgi:hypothetical protein
MQQCTAIGDKLCTEIEVVKGVTKKRKQNNSNNEQAPATLGGEKTLDERIDLMVSDLSGLYQQRFMRDERQAPEALAFFFMPHKRELGKHQGFVHTEGESSVVNELEMLCHAANGTTKSASPAKKKKRTIKSEYLQFPKTTGTTTRPQP